MFGFMSTSKSLQEAQKFKGDFIFVVEVPEMTIPAEYDKYDHGYVDINNHRLAEYENEE